MKRFFYISILSLLCAALPVRAEDAAAVAARQEADENYKMLKAKVDDLSESRTVLLNRIQSLEKEITELRIQVAKPPGNFASTEDLKRLADTIQEVDKKRIEDNKKVIKELGDLGNSLTKTGSHHKDTPHIDDPTPPPAPDQPTFTYTVKQGDYLSTIVKAYHEQGVNVTVDEILKANPGLKATALYPGKKIQIPDTRVASGTKPDSK
jgi:LysM repeat protein